MTNVHISLLVHKELYKKSKLLKKKETTMTVVIITRVSRPTGLACKTKALN